MTLCAMCDQLLRDGLEADDERHRQALKDQFRQGNILDLKPTDIMMLRQFLQQAMRDRQGK